MVVTLAILLAVNILNIYDRVALAAVVEPIRREFHLSDAQVGAISTLFIVVYSVAGIPLGRMADRGSRRRLLAAGVAVWAAMTAATGLATSYLLLLLTRLGVGVGESVCAPTATSWIGDAVPAERRARALSIFMLATPIGSTLALAIGGPVAQALGWRAALFAAALPALFLVPAVLWLKEPARSGSKTGAPPSAWSLLKLPAFRWIIVSGALLNFNLYVISTFLPAFLTRYHGFSLARAGFWSGVTIGITGVLGGLVAGAIGDGIANSRPGGRMLAAAVASAVSAPVLASALLASPGSSVALPLLGLGQGALVMYYGLVYAAIQDIVAPERRGLAMSIYFLAMYLCGGAFGPLLTGRLSDWLAQRAVLEGAAAEAARAAGLHGALFLLPAISLLLAIVLWAGARSMVRDRLKPA